MKTLEDFDRELGRGGEETRAAGLADPGRKVDLTERSVRRGE